MVTSKPDDRKGWVRQRTAAPKRTGAISRMRFARSDSDAVIGGVAGGIGARIGVDAVVVRIAFVVLAFAGAVGVIAYIVAWSVALDPGDPRAPAQRDPDAQQAVAFSAIALGAVILLRTVGLWLVEGLFIPIIIGAVGAGVVSSGTGRRAGAKARSSARPSLWTLIVGGVFVVGGVTYFLATNRTIGGIYAVVLAIGVTTLGLGLVFGPWVFRMTDALGEERRDRIRSEERAELAAHLHDSVLQTLALIQRNASSPRKMAGLARRQERELRAWLYGQFEMADGIEAAVHHAADAIEEAYEVTVETVIVGECAMDDRMMAVVAACREAATNAARHSGVPEVSVYIECEPESVTAFVRDRGKGFDPDNIPSARRGIVDSIRGRIERHGGSVVITSAPGEGCEVQITMPIGRNGANR